VTDLRNLSSLPDDREYWDDLEARVMADLGSKVRARTTTQPSWAPLARGAWRLGGLAAAAAIATLLFAPARSADATAAIVNPAGLLRLPPGDPALRAFVQAAEPPPLAWLLLPEQHEGSR
jgi:hypothetical protein